MHKRPRKVVAYVLRDSELLVFEHRDYPEAGVQVPAGTVGDSEDVEAAVLRETAEETGLKGVRVVRYLGSQGFDDPDLVERHYFVLASEAAPDKWLHWERHASGTTEEFAFNFYWIAIDKAAAVLHPSFTAKLHDLLSVRVDSPTRALPSVVLANLAGDYSASVSEIEESPITSSSGAATGKVARLRFVLHDRDGRDREFSLIRKSVRPLESGPHAPFAKEPTHWAFWKRELLAYSSDLLPKGPGLAAPRCFGTEGYEIYLEEVLGDRPSADRAADHLAQWQSREPLSDAEWLTQDQLSQRIFATKLNWNDVDADTRAVALWEGRKELLQTG